MTTPPLPPGFVLDTSGQYGRGNIDLTNRPRVKNPDGSISTVRSISANFDGQEVLIPTVSDDGRIMSDDEAIQNYRKTGKYLGKFKTPEEANAYAESLHNDQAAMYAPPNGVPPLPPGFQLETPITDLPGVTSRPDFSGVSGAVDSTEADPASIAPDGWEYGVGRDVAFSGRSALQGAGSLLGAVGGDAFNHYITNPIARTIGAQEVGPLREQGAAIADKLNLPKAQSGSDRILGDVGEGLTGTALTLGAGGVLNAGRNALNTMAPTVAQRVGNFLTAQPGLQALSTVTGVGAASATREAGGSQGTQLAAGLAGGLGPGLTSAATGATVRGLVRGRDGANMQETINNFAALGATPSVGQASGNRMIQGAENLLAGAPTSTGVMNRFAERQADDIGGGLQKIADNFQPNASAERAGRAIERGAETLKGNTTAVKRALYWQADRLIPDSTPAPLGNTWQTVVKLTTPDPGATATTGALVQPTIARLRQNLGQDIAAGGGQLTYSALKRIRSDIGEAISNSSPLVPSTDIRELRQLYGALSRDMEGVARTQGPEAVAAAKRANNYTRAAADRLEQVERVIDKNGGPERVFQAAMAGTRDGGTTIRAVMQSLPKEGQEAVTAAVIKRMGLANPGMQDAAGDAFSAATFLRKWNDVSDEAKRALFDRHGPGFTKDMDRIASVAENIKEGSKVFANPSGTANRAAALTYGAGLVASLFDPSMASTAGLVGSGIGANWLARKLTDPAFVKLLARSTSMPTGAFVSQAQMLKSLGKSQDDPETVAVADALLAEPRNQKDE